MHDALAVVVLAAGQGTRMKSALPKVLHGLGAQPMLGHVLGAAKALGAARMVVVTAPGAPGVAAYAARWGAETMVQERQLGTGHAVLAAAPALAGFEGNLLVLFGDVPLLTPATLARLIAKLDWAEIAALGFRSADPTGYGRMVAEDGRLSRIVEQKDASESEQRIDLCFAGMMAGRARDMFACLGKVGNRNAQGEFYLTDIIAIANASGLRCGVVEGPEDEMQGVNSRSQLADAEAHFQARRRREAMDSGVTLTDPTTVYFAADTVVEGDVSIGPFVVFGPGVTVRTGAEIKGFCHIEGAEIGAGAIIGPFARLRPGAVLEEGAHVGNFVEVKNARLGKGAKANHLTYIGDASVGEGSNIGAGTITCNYDGVNKHKTEIGARVFIGSNATLVAPVSVGDDAYVAAGSTVTDAVEAGALALGRARQVVKTGRAKDLRARHAAKKDQMQKDAK